MSDLASLGASVIEADTGAGGLQTAANRAAFAYYRKLLAETDGTLPDWSQVSPEDMMRFLPQVIVLGVLRDPLNFRYRLVGTYYYDFWQTDLTGKTMREIPAQQPGSIIWESLAWVVAHGRPISSTIPYIGPRGDRFQAEDLIMPFSHGGGETVDRLMVTVEYYPADNG